MAAITPFPPVQVLGITPVTTVPPSAGADEADTMRKEIRERIPQEIPSAPSFLA